MERRHFLTLLAAAGTTFLGTTTTGYAVESTASPGLILGKGPKGRCDDAKNGGPIVRWNKAHDEWWMWYYCRSTNFPEGVAPAFGSGSIALATSKDGIQWKRYDGKFTGGAIMEPSSNEDDFDSQHIGTGEIFWHDGEWVSFYFGGDASTPTKLGDYDVPEGYQFKGYRCRPGVARSKDGIEWQRVKGRATGGASVDIGEAIYGTFTNGFHDGKQFVMMYTALSPAVYYWETRVAVSTNLVDWQDAGTLQWSEEAAPWELGGIVTRHVMLNPIPDQLSGRWMMVYSGLDSRFPLYTRKVGIALSDDGMVWRHGYDDPVFEPAQVHRWDGGGVSYAQLVPTEDDLRLYYYGFADRKNTVPPGRGIGLAISESKDLRRFRRVTA